MPSWIFSWLIFPPEPRASDYAPGRPFAETYLTYAESDQSFKEKSA
jgi:hypothetical protein